MQKFLLGVVALAALAGWVMTFLGMKESSDLEDRLAAAKAELSETSERLTDSQSRLALQQGAEGSLKEIDERLAAKQAEAAALNEGIEVNRRELGALRQHLDSGRNELGALTDRVAASKSALARLAQNMEVATAELGQLRAEIERQRGSAISSPAETQPAAPVAASVTATAATEAATAIPAVDPLADAKRRFARIDQDGDGRFDRLDFRLKRVSFFGMVDANEDGYLTQDETLLSPEAFRDFDSDGDGKISSGETSDRRSFNMMDIDRDNFITFEEYLKFLGVSPE